MRPGPARARRWLCVLALAFAPPALAAAPAKDPAREAELRELRARIDKLQADLAAAEKSSGEAAGELEASARALSDAHRALFELRERRRLLEQELAELAERERAIRSSVVEQEELAAKLLRLQHRQGGGDRLRLALEGRDAATVSRHLAYYDYVQRARAQLIVGLRSTAEELAALEREARARRDELAENEQSQAREARRLEREREARAAVAARLAADIARSRREIGRLRRDEARLAKLVEEIARTLTERAREKPARRGTVVDAVADRSVASIPFPSLKGRLRLPVRGELANRYGAARAEAGTLWKGLFIRSATGETVRAVADGLVVYADWLRGFGNLLILDHGAGYMSLYGHNEGLLRKVGDKVRGGDPIAHVGQADDPPESGVYFELRREGKTFDPMSWVAQ